MVRASPEALCCVLEQDSINCLVLIQFRKRPDMKERIINSAKNNNIKIEIRAVNLLCFLLLQNDDDDDGDDD